MLEGPLGGCTGICGRAQGRRASGRGGGWWRARTRGRAAGRAVCSAHRPFTGPSRGATPDGVGARNRCKIVGKVESFRRGVIFTAGGNVRGTVSLKLLPAADGPDDSLRPSPQGDGSSPTSICAPHQSRRTR